MPRKLQTHISCYTGLHLVQTSDFKLQTSDFKLQTSNFKLQTSDFKLQTGKLQTHPDLVVHPCKRSCTFGCTIGPLAKH